MNEIINELIDRLNTVNRQYVNEEITSEEKHKAIDTAKRTTEIIIGNLTSTRNRAVLEEMETVLSAGQRNALKKALYGNSIV